ncbi:MAG: glycosyltransferase [Candidatus Goldbacteria bacterium]|nr:glycosyltransferase [Candidatus Goldiibacteriota bacterium]
MEKQRKKVLVLTSTFPRWKDDTLPPFVYELSKRLAEYFDITVLAPSYPGAKDFEIMDGMKVYRFHYFLRPFEKLAGSGGILPVLKTKPLYYLVVPFFLLGEYLAARKIVKEIKPDIIHAHWIIPQGLIAYFIKKKYNVPYVVTSHGSDLMGIKNFNSIKNIILKNAKNITVVSNFLKEEVKKINLNLKADVIPMGVDSELFNPNKKDLNIKKKYKIEGIFLLYVGRLAPEKGVEKIIELMPSILSKYNNIKLILIGEGVLKDKLLKKVKELKIVNNVIFIKWINNRELPKYYATADYFICLSEREGMPISYIEALACGTPIIVNNLPVCHELVGKNRGYILKNNVKEQILLYLLKNKKINKMRLHNYIKRNYDWKNITNKYLRILK